jgi:predicted DNA-binding transcriptional regulator
MVNKDQSTGGAILLLCAIVAILYILTLSYPQWLVIIGLHSSTTIIQFWVIAVPVLVAFVAIMFIGAWIGLTMATTPPPKPIEEITTEIEEKKEELK